MLAHAGGGGGDSAPAGGLGWRLVPGHLLQPPKGGSRSLRAHQLCRMAAGKGQVLAAAPLKLSTESDLLSHIWKLHQA